MTSVDSHLVLIDELDFIHARIGQLADLGTRIVWTIHAPAVRLGPRIGLVLDERA